MRLRQKLFAAILAVMVILFLMVALVTVLHALEAQRTQASYREAIVREFNRAAASGSPGRWERLADEFAPPGPARGWAVLKGGELVAGDGMLAVAGAVVAADAVEFATHKGYALRVSRSAVGLESMNWLPSVFWAMAAGTAFLMLVIYGLLLRLVLRPIDDLLAASRAVSEGVCPPKVTGDRRVDEIGELVRAFNRMADEVFRSRGELEEKVAAAVADFERAQKRLALEQRLSATGKLAAGVAHEIANPLGGMINAARSLAGEEGLSERGGEYVGLVNDGLARVKVIVERMRSFVRPKPAVGPVDVAEAVRGALAFARHRIESEGVALDEEYPDRPARVVGDAGELQQVFLNLIVNALDAISALGGSDAKLKEKRLCVSVARSDAEEPGGARVIVEVADTGAGMTPEQLAGAFDLFYTTKGESTGGKSGGDGAAEGGSGLGLAIAHRIVVDHGGEIELVSLPNGTTARVSLPEEGTSA